MTGSVTFTDAPTGISIHIRFTTDDLDKTLHDYVDNISIHIRFATDDLPGAVRDPLITHFNPHPFRNG